jgi:hypothetical protein
MEWLQPVNWRLQKSDIKTSKRNALFSQRIRSAFSFPISHSGTDSLNFSPE